MRIINSQPPGNRKDLLETLQDQVGELISGPPEEKQQFKKMVADRLKELTEGRHFWNARPRLVLGFLEGSAGGGKIREGLFQRDWRHPEESRQQLLAGFQADGHFAVMGTPRVTLSRRRLRRTSSETMASAAYDNAPLTFAPEKITFDANASKSQLALIVFPVASNEPPQLM